MIERENQQIIKNKLKNYNKINNSELDFSDLNLGNNSLLKYINPKQNHHRENLNRIFSNEKKIDFKLKILNNMKDTDDYNKIYLNKINHSNFIQNSNININYKSIREIKRPNYKNTTSQDEVNKEKNQTINVLELSDIFSIHKKSGKNLNNFEYQNLYNNKSENKLDIKIKNDIDSEKDNLNKSNKNQNLNNNITNFPCKNNKFNSYNKINNIKISIKINNSNEKLINNNFNYTRCSSNLNQNKKIPVNKSEENSSKQDFKIDSELTTMNIIPSVLNHNKRKKGNFGQTTNLKNDSIDNIDENSNVISYDNNVKKIRNKIINIDSNTDVDIFSTNKTTNLSTNKIQIINNFKTNNYNTNNENNIINKSFDIDLNSEKNKNNIKNLKINQEKKLLNKKDELSIIKNPSNSIDKSIIFLINCFLR